MRALGRVAADAHDAALQADDMEQRLLGRARAALIRTGALPVDLAAIGTRVAADNDRSAASRDDLGRVRNALLAPAPDRTKTPPMWLIPAVAALLVVVGAATWFGSGRTAPLDVSVAGVTVADGAWVAAETNDREMAFSDGSRMRMRPGASLRLAEVRADGCDIDLLRGEVAAAIVPDASTLWRVRAGPFTVRVLGTRFDVNWAAERGELVIKLRRGKVAVDGPGLQGRVLVPGQRLRASLGARRVVVDELDDKVPQVAAGTVGRRPAKGPPVIAGAVAEARRPEVAAAVQSAEVAPEAALPAVVREQRAATAFEEPDRPKQEQQAKQVARSKQASHARRTKRRAAKKRAARAERPARRAARETPAAAARQPVTSPADPAEAAAVADSEPPWAALDAHRWCEAVDAAAAWGWHKVERASAARQLALGDAARLCRRRDTARRLYQRLATDHEGLIQADEALFRLGRLAFDAGRHTDAVRWFARYVRRRPDGRLAEAARGRILLCRGRAAAAGAPSAPACAAARSYLRHHRGGPRAAMAREALTRCSQGAR